MAFNLMARDVMPRLRAWRAAWFLPDRRQLEREALHISHLITELSANLATDPATTLAQQLETARRALLRASNLGSDQAAQVQALALLALACDSALGSRPSPLQIMAALGMAQGYVVQIGYAAGKPLALALAAILHVWSARSCHIVCAADYLALRDAQAFEALYRLCGCSVAAITHTTTPPQLEPLYGADILYASGRQLLSDFMRDHLLLGGAVTPLRRQLWRQRTPAGAKRPVTRAINVALIDDVEAVLVDEAASPVQISAAGNYSLLTEASQAAREVIEQLQAGRDYHVHWQPLLTVHFTRLGKQCLPQLALSLPLYWQDPKRCADLLALALLARDALQVERHYVVQEGQVRVIDDKIYPLLAGRAWHFGVLQALEARAGLSLTIPPRTISRTAYQTFFPRYQRLAGASSTLDGLRHELWHIYALRVLALAPMARSSTTFYDFPNRAAKLAAFADLIERLHRQGLPLLAAAPRVPDALAIAQVLIERGIPYVVVDGRDLASDVQLLSDAAEPDRVTLLTGAGGRSLAVEIGSATQAGLHALLFEPWESHRIDLLFFARASQGFQFVSLEDELLTKNLPFWAAGLRQLATLRPLRRFCAKWLTVLAQRQADKKGSVYRHMLVQREQQLDQQLAFSKKD